MHLFPNEPEGDALRHFQMARVNPENDNEEFAAIVCGLAIFQEKLALAAAIIGRHDERADDAGQKAFLTMRDYLAKTRGWDFQGTSADDFGGWLYRLSRQHVRWALGNLGRSSRRRQHYENLAWRELGQRPACESQFIRREWMLTAFLKLPLLHRRVLAAWLRREPVEATRRRLGISRRTYYRLLEEAIDRLRKLLSDGNDDCSSLIPG